jgi:hypothetical protein
MEEEHQNMVEVTLLAKTSSFYHFFLLNTRNDSISIAGVRHKLEKQKSMVVSDSVPPPLANVSL